MRLRVLFLVLYYEAWDALEGTYLEMISDPRFEPFIAVMPRKLTGQADWGQVEEAADYFASREIPVHKLKHLDQAEAQRELQALAPDYVFINYPWMRNYPPGYRIEDLGWTRVCYVPYFSLALVNEPGVSGIAPHLFLQQVHQQARMVFSPDLPTHEALLKTDRMGQGTRGVDFVGSPKLDQLITRARKIGTVPPKDGGHALKVMWAPHHSYDKKWLNFGNFPDTYLKMLRWARKNSDVEVLLRPHPFLFTTMTGRKIIKQTKLDSWLTDWNALPNTRIDTQGEFLEQFRQVDLLFTDGLSFLAEYPLSTDKPAVFLERRGHWKFTRLGTLSRAANIPIRNFREFRKLAKAVANGQNLPNRDDEIQALSKAALPSPGSSAGAIVETVWRDWSSKPKL